MARRYFRFVLDEGEMRHFTLLDGAVGGLIAGWIAFIAAMITAFAAGLPTVLPWRLAASVVLGRPALRMDWGLGLGLLGLLVHFALCIAFGMLWVTLARELWPSLRDNLGTHTALAAFYGLLIWLLDIQFIARGLFPWFLGFGSFAQLLLHALAYGLPLGLYVATRVREVDAQVESESHA